MSNLGDFFKIVKIVRICTKNKKFPKIPKNTEISPEKRTLVLIQDMNIAVAFIILFFPWLNMAIQIINK
jgi:hypothetical protein